MKVRTVTVGCSIQGWSSLDDALVHAVAAGQAVSSGLIAQGFEVQTTRVSTQPFEDWLSWDTDAELLQRLKTLNNACTAAGVQIISIGPAKSVRAVKALPLILKECPQVSASVSIDKDATDSGAEFLDAAVETMLSISRQDPLGCFRYTVSFACRPGIPFFPAAFHTSGEPPTVTVGLENGDVVVQAFKEATSIADGSQRLQRLLTQQLTPLERTLEGLCSAAHVAYGGIDSSINPSLDGGSSLVLAYEAVLGSGGFGGPGTLAVSEGLTRAVRSLPVKLAGYCGLMLPALEDTLLAERAAQVPPAYGVADLLMYSSVCGVGIDTVPIPASCPPKVIRGVLLDVAALAFKWDKQLSCRFLPVVGAEPGDMTTFESPYMTNTRVFRL